MEADVEEIVNLFKSLNTNLSRHSAYHRILDELRPHEWRDAQKRINSRYFQKDILSELPLEIAVQIVQGLSLKDIFLLRRVSKRWYDVLSCDLSCRTMYRQYTGQNLAEREFQAQFAQYSKQAFCLDRGLPLCKVQLTLPFTTPTDIASLDYSHGRLAWMTDKTTIIVYTLQSQKFQRFCNENREQFCEIRLSELAVATYSLRGYCYVWDLETGIMHTIRLPHRDVSFFAAQGSQVVLSVRRPNRTNIEYHDVMHHDLKSGVTHTISLSTALSFVGLTTDTLTTISLLHEEYSPEPNHPHLGVVRYKLTQGDATPFHAYTVPLPYDRNFQWPQMWVERTIQRNSKNRLGVLNAPTPILAPDNHQSILPFTYDPNTDTLCMHALSEPYPRWPDCLANVDRHLLYYVSNRGGKLSVWISDPYAEPMRRCAREMDLELPRDPTNSLSALNFRSILGDRKMTVVVDDTSVKMWLFDETQWPPDDWFVPFHARTLRSA
ncbi:hypothetical protein P175DRAFT_0524471 [Aspergillus ochraceoroseus IBT 24754]|uniref:F-box domain-containing protein n=2 Tax=Aspergillus ochraceoroseus TaxID=138278 RepID=A0A2T5LVA2_9EURO|nr:uncharacterized protein P175DRAFT_0524471 [Aspergillus ochraceoroseus IBT 24754]KKK25149.1 hypothetical protein AOCH_002799 [Aspergillus ochraceoroseus]PTU20215.1 hypothetical protein P175DRAFT_0524471 [Aspergillus ochraceoroseus IBT 24754]